MLSSEPESLDPESLDPESLSLLLEPEPESSELSSPPHAAVKMVSDMTAARARLLLRMPFMVVSSRCLCEAASVASALSREVRRHQPHGLVPNVGDFVSRR